MEFSVIRARDRGMLRARHQVVASAGVIGEFRLRDVKDEELRRHSKVATLVDRISGGPVAGLPPLWDAVLGFANSDQWIVTGFEQVDGDGGTRYDHAQTWIMTPADKLTGAEAVAYNRERISGIRR